MSIFMFVPILDIILCLNATRDILHIAPVVNTVVKACMTMNNYF